MQQSEAMGQFMAKVLVCKRFDFYLLYCCMYSFPSALCSDDSKHMVRFATFKLVRLWMLVSSKEAPVLPIEQFCTIKPDASLEDLLGVLANAQEFENIVLRRNEKKLLNTLNKSQGMRFPIKVRRLMGDYCLCVLSLYSEIHAGRVA